MTAAEYDAWVEEMTVWYAQERAAATGIPLAVSLERARAQLPTLLPQGQATPGMHLFVVVDDTDTDVGVLWLGRDPDRSNTWYVWDVSVGEQFRGRGLGRATMLAAERVARRAGGEAIGLNVYGLNTVARKLYESLGYGVVSQQMLKDLRPR